MIAVLILGAHLHLIVPATVWAGSAWKILRSPTSAYPGCGAEVVGEPTAGYQNEGIWYIELQGSQAQIDCAEQVLKDVQP